MKRKILKKLKMSERKYALCLMLAGFAALNTGFTSQSDNISRDVKNVEEVNLSVEENNVEIENLTNDAEIKIENEELVNTENTVEYIEEPAQENIVETYDGVQHYADVMAMEATAYLPTDGSGSGMTAMGLPATYGVVAVDPQIIPLGTRVYIPGYGEAVAADTGGAIQGYKIDLCMESYSEAMDFGRRNVTVYVLK